MKGKPFIHVVAIDCPPDLEEKFNKWYEGTHIPMIFKFKGMKKATRYKITRESGEYPRYLAIYEFGSQADYEAYEKSPELAAALVETGQTWPDRKYARKWRVQYEAIRSWER